MIFNYIFDFFVDVMGSVLGLFPSVSTLPTIGGFDIDAALVLGVAQLRSFMEAFWFLQTLFAGFLALVFYYLLKIVLRTLIGHRAPA